METKKPLPEDVRKRIEAVERENLFATIKRVVLMLIVAAAKNGRDGRR